VAKRPRYSRWRRLPPVYRSGQYKLPDPDPEPRRISLYIKDELLEAAERQAELSGFDTVQRYCENLLVQAIQTQQVHQNVADLEAKRGELEGLNAIANDPDYLVEWSAHGRELPNGEARPAKDSSESPAYEHSVDLSAGRGLETTESVARPLSPSALVILRQAGHDPSSDKADGFLQALRRGETISMDDVSELALALRSLEEELKPACVLDRGLVFALHRLAFEGQILHTDAWPGVFDNWTIDTLRAVQESVERILSGQDIRYSNP